MTGALTIRSVFAGLAMFFAHEAAGFALAEPLGVVFAAVTGVWP